MPKLHLDRLTFINTFKSSSYLLLFPFLVYIITAISHLGFVRDDWAHYAAMNNLRLTGSLPENINIIISNSSTSPTQPRIFFASFLVHFIISYAGKVAPLLIYTYQTLLFVFSCIIAGFLIYNKTQRFLLSYFFSILLLVSPITSQPSLWINNLFFVQPLFLSLVLLFYITRLWPSEITWSNIFFITLLSVAAISSGEIILFVILSGLALFTVSASNSHTWFKALVPLTVTSLFVAVYTSNVMVGRESSPIVLKRILDFPPYLKEFWHQSRLLADYSSYLYGKGGGIPISSTSIFLALLTLFVPLTTYYIIATDNRILGGIKRNIAEPYESARRQINYVSLMLMLFISSFIPLIIGLLNGSRNGPDLRYQYVPGFILIMLIAFILDKLIAQHKSVSKYILPIFSGVVAYMTFLSYHNILDVWGSQRKLDERIWRQIDRELSLSPIDHIITYHPDHQYLMAPYHSNAISDFQADWGIAGRLSFKGLLKDSVAIHRDAYLDRYGRYKFRHYYNDSSASCEYKTSSNKNILYISFDYPSSFSAMLKAPFFITRDYSMFNSYKTTHYRLQAAKDLRLLKALGCN